MSQNTWLRKPSPCKENKDSASSCGYFTVPPFHLRRRTGRGQHRSENKEMDSRLEAPPSIPPIHALHGLVLFLLILLCNRHILTWPEGPFTQQCSDSWYHERTNQEGIQHHTNGCDNTKLHQHLNWQCSKYRKRSCQDQTCRCNNRACLAQHLL